MAFNDDDFEETDFRTFASALPFIQHAIDNLRTFRTLRNKYDFGIHEPITPKALRGCFYMELRIDIFTAVAETVKVITNPYLRTPAYAILLQALNDIFHNKRTDFLLNMYADLLETLNIDYPYVTEREIIETVTIEEEVIVTKE